MAMAPDLDRLRGLVFGRFIELLFNTPLGEHNADALRAQAAKEIVEEERSERQAAAVNLVTPPSSNITADNALDILVARIWKICENQRISKKLMVTAKRRRKKMISPPIAPVITANPIEVGSEPATTITRERAAPLMYTGFSGPTLIPENEYMPGVRCREVQNLRASVEQNELIRKHREQQSAAHRNRTRYMG
jgi:hypothetical protein